MIETETLVVGASLAGLAVAATLQQQHLTYKIIEKQAQTATPWRRHYERLHLHTNKRISHLPFKKFDHSLPRYPSRQQVVDYAEAYQKQFAIEPVFNTGATAIRKIKDGWLTETNGETFKSKFIVMATGAFSQPRPVHFKGMDTFPGKIMHSCDYITGKDFSGQNVLVVGFGNSACEIAIDLFEQGAVPSMTVRSPVNIIPRDVLGIPILELSILMRHLPIRVADAINAPIIRLLVGNLGKLGLQQLPYGPLEQIEKDGTVPVLDMGIVHHIRKGHIRVCRAIEQIAGNRVYFADGRRQSFDAIVAAIGYTSNVEDIMDVHNTQLEDLKAATGRQKYFGKDGLYFCGYRISATGQIRQIGLDALQIALHIAGKSL